MQIDWLACAHEALGHFPVSPKRVSLVSRAENVSFYVESKKNERFVLRIHRPEYHTLSELISEQVWTEALLSEGIDVPIVVRTADGKRYAQIVVNGGERNAGLLRWVNGKSLREQSGESQNPEKLIRVYKDVGSLLAILHEQASIWMPPPDFERHAFDEHGLMGERPFWGRFWEAGDLTRKQLDHLLDMRHQIFALLTQLPKDPDVYSLIHADLHTGNLISHGDSLHIIDFDDAGFGWHTYDFAVALSGVQETKLREPLLKSLFEGYEAKRCLKLWVKNLVPLFSVIRHLVHIGWIDARPDLSKDPAYKRVPYRQAAELFDDTIADAKKIIATIPSASNR
ncbi:MAG: phosphotransferase [Gammaproteobacteria bacterium]|nr:phosphotransferase [Gammaproteobacteria bacterium]